LLSFVHSPPRVVTSKMFFSILVVDRLRDVYRMRIKVDPHPLIVSPFIPHWYPLVPPILPPLFLFDNLFFSFLLSLFKAWCPLISQEMRKLVLYFTLPCTFTDVSYFRFGHNPFLKPVIFEGVEFLPHPIPPQAYLSCVIVLFREMTDSAPFPRTRLPPCELAIFFFLFLFFFCVRVLPVPQFRCECDLETVHIYLRKLVKRHLVLVFFFHKLSLTCASEYL